MIVVDTSALMAIIKEEPEAQDCIAALTKDTDRSISAGTAAEAMIVADNRGVGRQMRELIERLAIEVVPVTSAGARLVAAAYGRWGRGKGSAGLNFGDCFAYALAKERGCDLLFIGGDFAKTDVSSATDRPI